MNLKGDIITKEDCYEILKSNFRKDAQLIEYSITKANDKTVGFLGDYFHLKLSFKTEGEVREEVYFLKTKPLFNETQRSFVQECGIFKKEAFLYEKVIPELIKITRVNFAPRCLLIREEVLVLEDLKNEKFNIVRRDYTLQECKALMKTLALFHGSSIVYEEKLKASGNDFSFSQYKEKLPEGTFSFDESNPKYRWLKCVTTCVIDFLRTQEVYDESLESKLLSIIFCGKLKKSIEPSDCFRNVLTHNDLWSNNIFLSKNESCMLIDFQLVRYTPPAYDLVMALFLNNSTDFLGKYFDHFLALYYDTFSQLLKDYQLDPNLILPLREFHESVKMYKIPALIEATMFATNVYLPEDKSAYIRGDSERYKNFTFSNRAPFIAETFKNDILYRTKIRGLLIALAETIRKEIIP